MEPFNDPVTPKVDSILDLAIILDIYAVSRFDFEYDVAVGLFYQTPYTEAFKTKAKGPQDPPKRPLFPIVADMMNLNVNLWNLSY